MVETLQDRMTQTVHSSMAAQVTPFTPGLHLPMVQRLWSIHTTAGLAALNQEVTRQAAMIAYIDNFEFMMVITLSVIPLLLLLRRTRQAGDVAHAAMD